LKTYIDFDACGRDLEIGGNYLVTSRGVFELM
ncbi:antirestriction protein ArdA, partial [Enterococcus faecium]|nr:antirestriction protein ArdA [Enterococcus faecium]MBG0447687.1 antirestriction protein ArdA [Enterococcus faecium]MBG0461571.1 antirestriction protein ArdA [Enterococcus faecium]MBG0475338.1 antirestriction protein ArdA [Enterococcus faecium]MBG7904852.1 antirestriction protein ArdA [Enterococcus faecium]